MCSRAREDIPGTVEMFLQSIGLCTLCDYEGVPFRHFNDVLLSWHTRLVSLNFSDLTLLPVTFSVALQ